MIEKILFIGIILFVGYVYDNGFFRLIEKHYCKKNKGNCENCKCWSCEKYNQDFKNRGVKY